MLQTFKNAWKNPDLRKKMIFTLVVILLYRIGAALYIPFVDVDSISSTVSFYERYGGIFTLLNTFSGGAFGNATFFALSVSPYITAQIVMQLLCIAIPALERLSKREDGKEKINVYTRWMTVALGLLTAYGYINILNQNGLLLYSKDDGGIFYFSWVVMVACLGAGAAIIMWLAEQINRYGIGQGISVILFANIIARVGTDVVALYNMVAGKTGWGIVLGIVEILISVALTLAAIIFIIWFTNSERRIKIMYAKRVVGRKQYGGSNSNLPLKLNMAGVMPVIFASSIASVLPTIAAFFSETNGFRVFVENWLGTNTPIYIIAFIVMIFAFSYFYISISFEPNEVSNNIRSQGGSIQGVRAQEMAPYIKKILNRTTLLGALFLTVISGVPLIVSAIVTACGGNFTSMAFTGTSLLIVVGVALETVQTLEAEMSMRNYKGFLD